MISDAIRRTKLVCTIGPASVHSVGELVDAGMDVARVNLSHGDPTEHAAYASAVREAAAHSARHVAVVVDLPGPKIRLGDFESGEIELEDGRSFIIRSRGESPGTAAGATVAYPRLAADLRPGDRILLADGAAELRVVAVADEVETEVVRGGRVRSRAGVSVPADRLSIPAVTERDREGLRHARELQADFVAQSFVRRAEDIAELRQAAHGVSPPIIAKLETRAAIEDLDRILELADAVMVARGDLGVEVPYEEVPIVQKDVIRRALGAGVPSIVATQMLESMTTVPRPTRAEASDVANAVLDGADAVMLSAETAIGAYPVAAASAAVRICRYAERHLGRDTPLPASLGRPGLAIADAAVTLVRTEKQVVAIGCHTRSGRTAATLAALRPPVPIFAISPDPAVVRRMALFRGVVPLVGAPGVAGEQALPSLVARIAAESSLPPGALVALVVSTGEPGGRPNVLELARLEP